MHFAFGCPFQSNQYSFEYSGFPPMQSHQGKCDIVYEDLALNIHISKPQNISTSISSLNSLEMMT